MPKAEVGSTKFLNNRLKSRGLQKLRWYCQVCEKQTRDENGFKCHVQSESHVRQMMIVGQDSRKYLQDYSNQFNRDFLQLLRTAHGEKKINLNHFYQEYIANKEHIHMNATKWNSLMEYGKHLGREGICRVEEGDKGLEIAWIDNSPEALRRQDAIRKKERQDKGDEEREQRLIQEQVERARRDAEEKQNGGADEEARRLQRDDGEKIKLNFGSKPAGSPPLTVKQVPSPPTSSGDDESVDVEMDPSTLPVPQDSILPAVDTTPPSSTPDPAAEKIGMKLGGVGSKPKNVFASGSKKNQLGGAPKSVPKTVPQRPMSEVERIMKEEMERKRARAAAGFGGPTPKRQKM